MTGECFRCMRTRQPQSGPGTVNCPNFANAVQFIADVGAGTEFDCGYSEETATMVPKVLCEWP